MKKLFLIPIMALLVVLGMSFTSFESETEEQPIVIASDYVLLNGNWVAIAEQDCNQGPHTCKVKFSENGQPYEVYDEMSDLEPKPSSSTIIRKITLE